ncbi:MAG: alpha/beta fold hydrolase [Nibricoccus sp.]
MRHLTLLLASVLLATNLFADTTPAANTPAAPSKNRSYTFVLVHGAWAGGWEWKKLGNALLADGHTVYRPTLTGQGDRYHLANRDIGLNVHIQDIANFIVWEDLRDVVLVGHSYGGAVITGVIDQIPDRIKHVIYVDAIVPENGESAYDAFGRGHPRGKAVDGFLSLGDKTQRPPPHVVPQSEKTFAEPIALHNQERARRLPSTYILTADKASEPEKDGFYVFYERAKKYGWKTIVMEGDHIVHLTKTQELARLLEEAP